MSFTATYEDGTTGSVIPSSYTPTSFGDTAGTQTVTFSFAGTDITVDVDYDVVAPVLDSLEITGSLTNTQYLTDAPDLTGLTIKAVYDNGDEVTLSASDVVVTPSVWTYSATAATATVPASLNLTISYTDDGVTETSTIEGVTVHGKTEYTLPLGQEGAVYYDGFSFTYPTTSAFPMTGPASLFMSGATPAAGDWVSLTFSEDDYENDTLVDGQKFMGYVGDYGVDTTEWGFNADGESGQGRMNGYKLAITGEATASTGGTAVVAFGPLLNAISAQTGYKRSDIDSTDPGFRVYTCNFTV